MIAQQLDLIPDICPHGLPTHEICAACVRLGIGDHHFDGATYEPEDKHRLNCQLRKVFDFMRATGKWHPLSEIADAVDGSESGVSARLRDFRKARFGEHTVERRRVSGGLFEYRLVANGELR